MAKYLILCGKNLDMMRKKPIVALVYDFDGTLSPGNMQEFGFIQAIGKDPKEFWTESDDICNRTGREQHLELYETHVR